jgi:hypothetical protein
MIANIACQWSPYQFVVSLIPGSQLNQELTQPLLPGEGRHHRDDPVGDQDRGPHRSTGEHDPVHHHREREADDELDGHRHDHDDHRVEGVGPEERVAQDRDVVAEPYEPLVVGCRQAVAEQ